MSRSTCQQGFTILEVVIALFLISIGVIATAPMFVYAVEESAATDDLTTIGTIAVQRIEQMRGMPFNQLQPGGSLTADVNGYFDDSDPDYLVRWMIVNATLSGRMRLIEVRVMAYRGVRGEPKEVTVTTLRGM